jgi:hypothetical protein
MKKLRVGVTIFIRQGEQSLWENGIFQNCLYLVRLLEKSPLVSHACLLASGSPNPRNSKMLAELPIPSMTMDEAMHGLDFVIDMSAQLDPVWINAFREKGGSVVAMRVGNDYVIDIERIMFNKPNAMLANGVRYDEIWTLPEYEKTGVPYYRAISRSPIRILPHLWSSEVFDRALAQHKLTSAFGYRPGRRRWRVGIVEPNICMVKTCFIPLLSCDDAHRHNPELLEKVMCYNALNLREQPRFKHFVRDLDLVRHGLAVFEGRFPMFGVLGHQIDAVFSHQWENAQNYVYYEVLYGAYPLIHNSPILKEKGAGYYYEGFDCEDGGRALIKAFVHHDENLREYRKNCKAFIKTLAPEHKPNIAIYSEAMARLVQSRSASGSVEVSLAA